MNFQFDTISTPLGQFSIAIDERGAVAGTAFGGRRVLAARLGPCHLALAPAALERERGQVLAYFAGQRSRFSLRLAPRGRPFQHRVWEALRTIPYGETRTYGEIAGLIGNSAAARAVGRANGANPLCLFVPCHRVIGADGSLTGFAFGKTTKRRLLELERSTLRAAQGNRAKIGRATPAPA